MTQAKSDRPEIQRVQQKKRKDGEAQAQLVAKCNHVLPHFHGCPRPRPYDPDNPGAHQSDEVRRLLKQ